MRKASLEDEVTAFEVADSTHPLPENVHVRVRRGGRRQIANTEGLHGLLRARRERPRHCRAAKKRDERAPLHLRGHSITSSARAESVGGTSIPSAFAVFRLMMNSNLVDCTTGR